MANASNMITFMVDAEWQTRVKNFLKGQLKAKGVTYFQLAEKLTEMGIPETEANIRNKISRGGFTAVFFVQCLVAAGVTSLRLEDF